VEAKRVDFGTLQDGSRVEAAELSNSAGMSVRIIALGAAIQSLTVPDRNGTREDVVLGYDSPRDYLAKRQYFGATVGRYANRIARGKFTLDGHEYQLETNDGPNHLHGGLHGLDTVLWTIDKVTSGPVARVELRYVSPDGAGAIRARLTLTATYTLNERNELAVEYRATTDKPTIVNYHQSLVLQSRRQWYRARASAPAVCGQLHAGRCDIDSRPANAAASPGTPFDFRQPRTIGEHIRDGKDEQLRIGRGYDHNFVISGQPAPTGSA
jgi:aldose 1-epimerase